MPSTSESPVRQKRSVKAPQAKLSEFLTQYLERHHLTGAEVARRLGVSELMIWRLAHGVTLRFRKINKAALAQALELDEQDRRTFFDLTTRAGVVFAGEASAPAGRPDAIKMPVQIRYRQVDLDIYELAIQGWAAAAPRDPRAALEAMQQLNMQVGTGVLFAADDLRLVKLRISSTMLLGALQETVLPWWKERPRTVQTYNALAKEIFHAEWAKEAFPREYAQLILRRAVLYREAQQIQICEGLLARLDEEALKRTQDPVIMAAYYSQHLHTLSKEGRLFAWQRESDALRRKVEGLTTDPHVREELLAIVDYTIGVGYKSFMWNLRQATAESATRLRRTYAEQAYHWLAGLHAGPQSLRSVRHINLYHGSLTDEQTIPELESSEIDALVWYAPEEALRRAIELRPGVERLYPSVVKKLDSNISLAQKRLGLIESPARKR